MILVSDGTMPRNTIKQKSILYKTAEDGTVRSGTGSVMEVTSRGDTNITTISCYAEVIPKLHLPSQAIDNSDYFEGTISHDKKNGKVTSPRTDVVSVVHRGNGYVSMYVPQGVMSRYELRDLLNGLGWTMTSHALCSHDGALIHSEIWSHHLNKTA